MPDRRLPGLADQLSATPNRDSSSATGAATDLCRDAHAEGVGMLKVRRNVIDEHALAGRHAQLVDDQGEDFRLGLTD
jgi:hypothetical protein